MSFLGAIFLLLPVASVILTSVAACGLDELELAYQGEIHHLDHYRAYTDFVDVVSRILKSRFHDALRYSLKNSKQNVMNFMTSINLRVYLILQLIYALEARDIPYSSLLIEASNAIKPNKNNVFGEWIHKNMISPGTLYSSLKFFIKIERNGLLYIPNELSKEMFYLGERHNVFEKACTEGDLETANWFLEQGYSLDSDGLGSILGARSNFHWPVLTFLLKKGRLSSLSLNLTQELEEMRNENNTTHLHLAARINQPEALIAAGGDFSTVDLNGRTPPLTASGVRGRRAVQDEAAETDHDTLIRHDVNASTPPYTRTVLDKKTEKDHDTVVGPLLELGIGVKASRTPNKRTVLGETTGKDHDTIIAPVSERGSDVKASRSPYSRTVLDKKTEKDHDTVVGLIPERSGEVKKPRAPDRRAASERDYFEVVKLLLRRGAHLIVRSTTQKLYLMTTLNEAKERGDDELIHLLVQQDEVYRYTLSNLIPFRAVRWGDDLVLSINELREAFLVAAEKGQDSLVSLLLKRGADVNATSTFNRTALHVAAEKGNSNVVSLLLIHGAYVNAVAQKGSTPLHFASKNGHDFIVKMLLEKGADVKASTVPDRRTALHEATENGHIEVVRLLLNHSADVSAKTANGKEPLHEAAENGDANVVDLLLVCGADVNAVAGHGRASLHVAAEMGHASVVSLLLYHGADVNVKAPNGRAPLHEAAKTDNIRVVWLLLNRNASVNARSDDNRTALHEAAENGNANVVNLLLDRGADVNSFTGPDKRTALHEAAERGHEQVVSLLLERDADVNAQTDDGKTPLYMAAANCHIRVVRQLVLQSGCNIDLISKTGYTPLMVALENGP